MSTNAWYNNGHKRRYVTDRTMSREKMITWEIMKDKKNFFIERSLMLAGGT